VRSDHRSASPQSEGGSAHPTRVLYILGTQRGGTNILGRVLGTIEGVAFAGELRQLWSLWPRGRPCECGKPYAECEVWSRVLPRLEVSDPNEMVRLQGRATPGRNTWMRTKRALRSDKPLSPASAEARYARKVADLYREFATASGGSVVVDISKHPVEAALLTKTPGISLFCVQIVRDPRGVVFSREGHRLSRRRRRREREGRSGTEHAHPFGATLASLSWLGRHLASEAVLRRVGEERALLVRYEDFVADPAATLKAVCQLVGVEPRWSSFSQDRTIRMPTVHVAAGRGRYAGEVTLAEDEKWKRQLRPIDRRIATILTRPRIHRYGYTSQ